MVKESAEVASGDLSKNQGKPQYEPPLWRQGLACGFVEPFTTGTLISLKDQSDPLCITANLALAILHRHRRSRRRQLLGSSAGDDESRDSLWEN